MILEMARCLTRFRCGQDVFQGLNGEQVHTVHDWDSLDWQPEAALAGAASGAFASDGPPTLAPVESSEAFLAAYQDSRGRRFTAVEQESLGQVKTLEEGIETRRVALEAENAELQSLQDRVHALESTVQRDDARNGERGQHGENGEHRERDQDRARSSAIHRASRENRNQVE